MAAARRARRGRAAAARARHALRRRPRRRCARSCRWRAPADDAGLAELGAELETLGAEHGLAFGLSARRRGGAEGRRGVREALDAAQIALALERGGGAIAYEALGAYKYLVHLRLDDAPRDRHWTAVERLLAYDARRRTQLVDTLEHYLQARRSVTTTARELYIHPNTLRQRLDRIEQLTGLELADRGPAGARAGDQARAAAGDGLRWSTGGLNCGRKSHGTGSADPSQCRHVRRGLHRRAR